MTAARILAAFGCLAVASCGGATEPPPTPAASTSATTPLTDTHKDPSQLRIEAGMLRDLRITTSRVESRRGDEQLALLGELAVDERSYAQVSAPVSARIVRLLVDLGDTVKDGEALLELQSPEVGRARSDYLSAMARAALADSVLERKRDLAAERIAPQREVQEAEADALAARSEARAAAAALSSMGLEPSAAGEADTARSSIFFLRSPVHGTVIDRRAFTGQVLDAGTPAFQVADLSTLWLTVHAYERDAVRIQHGSTARIAFSALPGEDFTGNVTVVGRQVSSESRTIDVRIEVRNRSNLLRPGMSASASLPIGANSALVLAVPVAAVQRVGDNWCVFLPKAEGLFEIRKIGRGRDLGTEVEILSGLKAGDTIVVDGAFLLKSQAEKSDSGHGGE
jgi:cobalt-zinc-cadmium efflux system membrane fusion protein